MPPGSIGGALYMNAGAYGGEVSDVLKEALVLTKEGELMVIDAEDLDLDYRETRTLVRVIEQDQTLDNDQVT